MQKRLHQIIGLIVLIAGIGILYLYQKEVKPIAEILPTKLAEKYFPSDQFFLQRSFPDPSFDLNIYTDALKVAKTAAKPRNNNFTKDWQTEGPGNLGARVNTIAVHPSNDQIIFAGYSGGGVFRTMDGGTTWKPVFDEQLFLAIGDIVFDPQDANTVYVGTGDPNVSGFPFLGDGLYKSTNLGETWQYIGLEELRIISKIIIDPTDNQTIYVAAMGLPFEPNSNKGLYKTTNGGTTWEQVLFLGGITGVIDVVFEENNPQVLYAAGWDRLRNNQISETKGQGAKIYKSIDGGINWKQLTGGLPLDDQSRIGLATTKDGVLAVYVDVDHNFQGLYRTVDGGNSWLRLPTDGEDSGFNTGLFGGFGWYFAKIRVNPRDDKDISVLGVQAFRTRDGGLNWELINRNSTIGVHSDIHELVFTNNGTALLGTDGGMYRFAESGNNWEDIENIPATQVYRVAYNPHAPANYYAGTQDNGTAGGNYQTINSWDKIYGGDGFQMVFHPDNPNIFYAESQRGNIGVTLDGGETWEDAREGIDSGDRKNWDTPYFLSTHNPDVLYTATHRVYASRAGAVPNWLAISPDLTDGPTEHLRQTVSTIHQSPLNSAILYAGTTDGNIWRSLNEGTNWEQLTGLPKRYFTEVVASEDVENTVFATISGYKDNENTPHIYKSTNHGDTWEAIAGNLPPLAINALQVIPGYADQIMFVGTDGGVYGTIDGGLIWERVGENMPIIATYDLEWNRGENTLAAGTFARSVLSYDLTGIVEGDNLSSVQFQTKETNELKIYPNPVRTDLTLEFLNTRPNKNIFIAIYSMDGKLMKQAVQKTDRAVVWKVGVSDLPTGTYLVKVQGEVFSFTERFVKL
ncbi:MAG: T9SS type A sorting domain-containing protein [Saprospiraceae bacterium]